VQLSYNENGTLHWKATVINNGTCAIQTSWIAPLMVSILNFHITVHIDTGTITLNPGTNVIERDICYNPSRLVRSYQLGFGIISGINPPGPVCFQAGLSNTLIARHNQVCSLTFFDVPEANDFYTEISALNAIGAVSGYSDGSFRPGDTATRGQLAKIVVQAFNLPVDTTGGAHFSDVPAGSTFYSYIETAYNRGLISGYADGTFRSNQPVTRGQVAKVVVQAAGWPLAEGASTFADIPIGSTFYAYIQTAVSHGVLNGYSDGTFRPANQATRGQIAKMVTHAMPALDANLHDSLLSMLTSADSPEGEQPTGK
jgi:hypothetical protein